MKRFLYILLAVSGLIALSACGTESTEMSKDYPSDYDINYALRKVLEKDPVNVNGIDVYPYFDFFKSLRFTIHVREGKMSSIEFSNGDIPFSPFGFDIPSGDAECWFDTENVPNALRLKSTGEAVAYFKGGEFYIPFQLDCKDINYEFTFKEISE